MKDWHHLIPDATTIDGFKRRLREDADVRNRCIVATVGLVLFVYAYFIQHTCLLGTTDSPPTSMMGWLWSSWSGGSEYAHGFVVPFVVIGLAIWKWRKVLHAVPLSTSSAALSVVVVGVLLYWVGAKGTNSRILAISMVILVFGATWYLAGWRWAKELWFPIAFLLFMIPLDFLEQRLAFPLRMFVARFAVDVLNLFGMDVAQQGTAIKSLHGRFQDLDVANPCSGIRSLVALMALTALYGYVTMDKTWKKWVLFLSSIPLAVIGNLARITTIAFVAQGFGQELATTIYHDYSGFVVFSLAILCMIALGASLNLRVKDLVHHWTQEQVVVPRPVRRRPAR